MAFEKNLIKKSEDLSEWYNRIVLLAELADYGPSKGTMIFRPYGYAIWELIQAALDKEIKKAGVKNAYFPLFIPESFLNKEKKHLDGFSPELAVVTIGGGEELQEKLIVRPTSETIMHDSFSRWIQSYRDLPLKINQWNNVVRWEKRTYLFLRTTEFLWQEGHTAHATHDDALETVTWGMDTYTKIYRDFFAVPGYVGKKSDNERFAGADMTLTYETLMPEGKALQSCTSHDLGQNFSKAFDIKFQDKDGQSKYVWLTSWGFSTRSIGGLLMAHGDDKGLRLPPRLAPVQIVVLPVKGDDDTHVTFSQNLTAKLVEADFRAEVDSFDSLGSRINKWEIKGAPVRLEIGDKEIAEKVVTLVRRDTGEKLTVTLDTLTTELEKILADIQSNLYQEAQKFLEENTREATSYEEFRAIMETHKGFIRAYWCEDPACESTIKEETKASTRCLPLDEKDAREGERSGKCVHCSSPAKYRWMFAQSY